MLFNSFTFIFGFLPCVVLVLYLAKSQRPSLFLPLLLVASFVFYAWWYPPYVLLFGLSVLVNFFFARLLERVRSRWILGLGIAWNLGLLGYYKYTDFAIGNINWLFDTHLGVPPIVLPLAISFFTFQFVAFLVDVFREQIQRPTLLTTCLFVAFFPHFIAGPIVRYTEIVPQLEELPRKKITSDDIFVATVLFVVGLFKKVVIADSAATVANYYFGIAQEGLRLTTVEGWLGILSYTIQIYFDFSGYSDMALGLARLFGVRLPLNFNSPYQALNPRDLWRRWHITLSRFLRDYLYFPLGGNRRGVRREYENLAIVMLLGGLWHGAGWTFVVWGGLHGVYLICFHAFDRIRKRLPAWLTRPRRFGRFAAQLVMFLLVVVAWVFFRAPDMGTAFRVLTGMSGLNGTVVPVVWSHVPMPLREIGAVLHLHNGQILRPGDVNPELLVVLLAGVTLLTLYAPNIYILLRDWRPAYTNPEEADPAAGQRWRASLAVRMGVAGAVVGSLAFVALREMASAPTSAFIYFYF